MRSLTKWFSELNIYYKLLPFLFLYLTICILFHKDINDGDQTRYLWFANNLLKGFYSPPAPDFFLWNGPGYPIFLAFFLFFKSSFFILRIANAFLLYFSLVISYKTISIYASKKYAIFFSILLGLYFPIFESLRQILSECLTWFLISLVCFLFVKNFRQRRISWKLILLAGISIAYLIMTKVIFGYVLLIMLSFSIFILLFPSFRLAAIKSTLIFLTSFIFCLPWLFYTYSLTKKPFYWADSGGMSLYTMSTPFAGETGQWYQETELSKNPNHAGFMDSISKLSPLQRDEAYKSAAVKNIKSHPVKYFSNYISNLGRFFFFPSDYAPDSILSYYPFIPNMFIVVFIVISIIVSLFNYKKIPVEIMFLVLFIFIYFLGSTALSSYRRMFHVTMPFWFFYFSYFLSNIIEIKIRK